MRSLIGTMKSLIALQVLVILIFDVTNGSGPLCLKCQDATSVDECRQQNKAPCGDDEDCYLRKYTTDNMEIRFEAGCFPKTTCALLSALNPDNVIGRRGVSKDMALARPRKDVTNCFQCCKDSKEEDPCNSHLCNQVPSAALITCKVCSGVHDYIDSCAHEDVCPPTEACYTGIRIVGTEAKYVFGCANKQICRSLAMDNIRTSRVIHGDIGLNICDACCVGRNCNEAECFALKKLMNLDDYLRNITRITQSTS
uniref:Uncharacterized protein LOC111101225 isoform X1 n=1 Tax=Crassostrea virginica TaxID=6565 RepID=A0A8B8ACY7_CRAVI|nr:uncharacterized protein LOC111101225 isoform X1 [Crassostrea virginica]